MMAEVATSRIVLWVILGTLLPYEVLVAFSTTRSLIAFEKGEDGNVRTHRSNNLETPVLVQDDFRCDIDSEVSCCASWEVVIDDWWLHNPQWEVTFEDETEYCFSKIKDPERMKFLTQVHQVQWNSTSCAVAVESAEINSGFGASVYWLVYSFFEANKLGRPFQIVASPWRWMFAPEEKTSWAYCAAEDISCYYLPTSVCPRNNGTRSTKERERVQPRADNNTEKRQFAWLLQYLTRPRHEVRKRIMTMRQKLRTKQPCTAMHIRRGDAGYPYPPYRRYAAVQEYIEAAQLKKGDNIVLLTDDESTIEEIQEYLNDDFNWVYLDRPRNRGLSGGWEGHIPSGDPAFEVLAISLELETASQCESIVHGNSGFINMLKDQLDAEGRTHNSYYVETLMDRGLAEKFSTHTEKFVDILFQKVKAKYRKEKL